jgi:hypothetical protein
MNYTQYYDNDLLGSFEHLRNHPQMLPFIGTKWENSAHKILLVAESHYLPKEYNNQFGLSVWYNAKSQSFEDSRLIGNTDTRANVEGIDESWGHSIHKNVVRSFNNVFGYTSPMESYSQVAFYNYYQRPAEVNGDSIKNNQEDDKLAYDFHLYLKGLIQPSWVMFLSKKSFLRFRKFGGSIDKVSVVPHPTSKWWNRKSKAHSDRTGKEKFEQIIKKVF